MESGFESLAKDAENRAQLAALSYFPEYYEGVIAFFCHLEYHSTVKQIIIIANYINSQEEETQ